MPPAEGAWRIHIEPDDGAPVPTGTFEAFELPDDETEADVSLGLGLFGDPVTVEGTVAGGEQAAVLVIARTTWEPAEVEAGTLAFEGGDGQLSIIVEPSDQGRFTLELVPGTWTLTAAPVDATHGVAQPVEVVVSADGATPPVALELTDLVDVSGRIVAPDGTTPVPNATVEATFSEAWGTPSASYGVADALWTSMAATDDEGFWALPLARGTWSVTVVPPEGLGFARWTRELTVDDTATVDDLALVEAGVVSGRVLDEDGLPIAGARVAGWQVDAEQSTLLDEAVTNDEGAWRLVLPARLAP